MKCKERMRPVLPQKPQHKVVVSAYQDRGFISAWMEEGFSRRYNISLRRRDLEIKLGKIGISSHQSFLRDVLIILTTDSILL